MRNYQRMKGMIAATFTPMDKDGEINLNVIEQYADWIASTPIAGVFVCGTTGEFASLTIEERKLIVEKWVAAADKRFRVIVHVGANCQKYSIELAEHACRTGADAIASIAPSFFKPDRVDDLITFFEPISAAASELPFYYYNMPSITGVNLPVDKLLLEGKKRISNLVGTKFTHNNLMEMGTCINLCEGDFEVLHGFDEILIAGLAMGAKAGVGSTYNYLPQVYNGIFSAMERGDLLGAQTFQMQSIHTVEVIIKYGGGVRGGKAIMKLIGIDCGNCRAPIASFSIPEYEGLKKDLAAIDFWKF